MATYDPGAIRAAIKNYLEAIDTISFVYDFLNPDIEGYPAVIFDVDNEDSDMLDDVSNQRVLTFKFWIACEIKVIGLENAKTLLDNMTRDIINVLEKKDNLTLSNTADWTMPVMGKRDQAESPEGNIIYQELFLKVYIASTIL